MCNIPNLLLDATSTTTPTRTSTPPNHRLTTTITISKINKIKFNELKDYFIIAFEKSLNISEGLNLVSMFLLSSSLIKGSKVVVSVAWLTKANAEKLQLKIQEPEFMTNLKNEISRESMIKDYEVTNIASPRIDVKPGKLILLYIYS